MLGLKATKAWAKPQGEGALRPLRPPHCLFTRKPQPQWNSHPQALHAGLFAEVALILDRPGIVLTSAALNWGATHFSDSSNSASKYLASSTQKWLLCWNGKRLHGYLWRENYRCKSNHIFAAWKQGKDQLHNGTIYHKPIWIFLEITQCWLINVSCNHFVSLMQKTRACYRRAGWFVLQWLTLQGTHMLCTCTLTYCTFTNKHTHAVYRRHVIRRQEAEFPKHTLTHTFHEQRAYSVCWWWIAASILSAWLIWL